MKVRFEVVIDVADAKPAAETLQLVGKQVVEAARELGYGEVVHAVVKTLVEPAKTYAHIEGAVAIEPEDDDDDLD